jgi:hypothetical protein
MLTDEELEKFRLKEHSKSARYRGFCMGVIVSTLFNIVVEFLTH